MTLENKLKKWTLSKWKKEAWKVFTQWIKERDGYVCFTCGAKCKSSGAHGGHFINASICGLYLYFHPDNVHCQCFRCNINLGGNQYIYGTKLGKKKVSELEKLRTKYKNLQYTKQDYLRIIEKYSQKNEQGYEIRL